MIINRINLENSTGFVLFGQVVVSGVLALEIERDGANEQVVPDQSGNDLLHQGGVGPHQFRQLFHSVRVLRVEKQQNRHLDRRRHQNVRLFRVRSRDLPLEPFLQGSVCTAPNFAEKIFSPSLTLLCE